MNYKAVLHPFAILKSQTQKEKYYFYELIITENQMYSLNKRYKDEISANPIHHEVVTSNDIHEVAKAFLYELKDNDYLLTSMTMQAHTTILEYIFFIEIINNKRFGDSDFNDYINEVGYHKYLKYYEQEEKNIFHDLLIDNQSYDLTI